MHTRYPSGGRQLKAAMVHPTEAGIESLYADQLYRVGYAPDESRRRSVSQEGER